MATQEAFELTFNDPLTIDSTRSRGQERLASLPHREPLDFICAQNVEACSLSHRDMLDFVPRKKGLGGVLSGAARKMFSAAVDFVQSPEDTPVIPPSEELQNSCVEVPVPDPVPSISEPDIFAEVAEPLQAQNVQGLKSEGKGVSLFGHYVAVANNQGKRKENSVDEEERTGALLHEVTTEISGSGADTEREAYFQQQQSLLTSLSSSRVRVVHSVENEHEHDSDEALLSAFERAAILEYATPPVPLNGLNDSHTVERKKCSSRQSSVGDRCVRVFISSTFKDMATEREIIIKRVMPTIRKACAKRGVTICEVDLRWGITTEQSLSGNTLSICLNEVDRCRPWFFCILGERYGWCHPENSQDPLLTKTFAHASAQFPWVMNFTDRSITELEIRHAILNKSGGRAVNIDHTHFFFRNPAYAKGRGPDYEETSPAVLSKVRKLKDTIQQQLPTNIHNYNEPYNLECILCEQVMNLLDMDFPEDSSPSPLERERQVHNAFALSRARVYVGGAHYLFQLNCFIATQAQNSHPTPIVVIGSSGSGKSALLCNYVSRFEKENPETFVLSHYIGCSSLSTDLGRMLCRLITEIIDNFNLPSVELPNDTEGLSALLPSILLGASTKGGMLLVIDALNQLDEKDNSHELHWLPLQLPPNVQLVTSVLPSCRVADVLSQRKWNALNVQPLEEQARFELVTAYMSECSKSLSSSQIERLIQTPQSSNPLFLRTILDEIRVHGTYETLSARIEQCLKCENIPDLLSQVLARIELDFDVNSKYVAELMSLIWLSRKGLLESEALSILDIPPVLWSELQLALSDLLASQSGFLNFSHDFVRQAVSTRYNPSSRRELRTKFIRFFQNQESVERKCEEVPYQFLQDSNLRELALFITAPETFFILSSDQYLFDLYKYFRACQAERPATLLVQNMMSTTVSHANLRQTGKFLQDLAYYSEAETLLKKALSIVKHGSDLGAIADIQDALGYLYRVQARYEEACPMYNESLETRKKLHGEESREVAASMCSLAILFRKMGQYDKAEPLYAGSCVIRKKLLGLNHPETGMSYNGLGCLYQDQGKDKLAEEHFDTALKIRERCHGPNHPDVAMTLSNFASLYLSQARYDEAERMFERAVHIYEDIFGDSHPDVAHALAYLAGVYVEKGKYSQAKPLFERALEIKKQAFGIKHPEVAQSLSDYGVLHARMRDFKTALTLYKQCLDIRREVLGAEHPDTAQSMNNVAAILTDQGEYVAAEKMFREALETTEKKFGPTHPNICQTLLKLANLFQRQGRSVEETLPLYKRSLAILHQYYGEVHPDIALTLNDMAVLCYRNNQISEAEFMYQEMVTVYQKLFPNGHPDASRACRNVAAFYSAIGNSAQESKFLALASS
ncbi:tetratricopeptide repeat protein [Pelomyxa schiedti]|nr:tetratricopeptide repeat protein [Pelomyxa schiedti]